ncbi:Uncharacterised protein [Mycobacteroides abscessus subsp. abscessus]|nr:Uncharacterised protein [Mycobacteroides abscessus subsp. abscessus]
MQHGRRPADEAAVGVSHQYGGVVSQRAHQAGGVPGQRPAVVAGRWLVTAAVAPQVDRDHTGAAQVAQLMPPRVPERGEPVQQDDQRTLGVGGTVRVAIRGLRALGLHDVEADPVRVYLEVSPRTVDPDDRRIRWRHYQPEVSLEAVRAVI